MSGTGKVVRSGVGRRKVQTLVIVLVVAMATASAVLGGTLVVASQAPFDRAFAQQHGAHLVAQFDAGATTESEVESTADAAGVRQAEGPFRTVSVDALLEQGMRLPSMTVAGREKPGGAVDKVTVTEGRWAQKPGEIVLFDNSGPGGEMAATQLGGEIEVPDLPGKPTLKIVGLARSVSESADAWVVPEQIEELTPSGQDGGYQMLYRFDAAATKAQVADGRDAIAAEVPDKAVTGTKSWLSTKDKATGQARLLVPFLIVFGLLGVFMAVLIVGNIVTGAVSSATRRIGILKALGFTPAQVVRSYMAQALIPAAIGAGIGVVAGNLLTQPVLGQTNRLYGTSDSGVVWWVDVLGFGGGLAIVAVTAWMAALRAGRLRSVDALSVGRTKGGGRGSLAARVCARLPLPRSITLGLAQQFARPGRALAILVAVGFGAAAVTFAFGLSTSLAQVQATQRFGDVAVYPHGPPDSSGKPPTIDADAVMAAIDDQDATTGSGGLARTEVTVPGVTGSVEAYGFTGDKSVYDYRMVSGDWFDGSGEIVVSTPFLKATETEIGDTITLTSHGEDFTVTIAGEVFNTEDRGMQILTDLDTLTDADPKLTPTEFNIDVKAGTDAADYADTLNKELEDLGAEAVVQQEEADEYVLIINSLTAMLTLLLIAVAAMGVLNTVVLETRDRVRDLGVCKAIGMVPRQTVAMVLASVLVTGLVGGALGVPLGMYLQRTIVGEMGQAAGYTLPAAVLDIYRPGDLTLFALGGLVIAVLGALLPAGWAARTRTATAIRAE